MIRWIQLFKIPILLVILFVGVFLRSPETGLLSVGITWDYFKEMIYILPPVFLMIGLMEVWMPKDKITKCLGRGAGVKGALLSLALGALPTGPLYLAFPIVATLQRKGASISNMVLFLGAWAALKIPQLLVEIKFLGVAFTGVRFILTLIALVIIATVMECILKASTDH